MITKVKVDKFDVFVWAGGGGGGGVESTLVVGYWISLLVFGASLGSLWISLDVGNGSQQY